MLRNAPPAATLEALAGVAIGPEDLRTIVTGCGFASGEPTRGRSFDRWLGGRRRWRHHELAAAGGWRVAADRRDAGTGRRAIRRLLVGPARHDSSSRIVPGWTGASVTDLTIRLSQVDINEPLDGAVFQVDVPPDATPMTLEQLRQAGPLGR